MTALRIPVATYRVQFNRSFRFEDARRLVPYLHELGISDLYASPILKARAGSPHGYDVTDPTRLNPELGTEEDFDALVQELKRHDMGLLVDIVPNHMAASPENPWWVDVLENGPSSPYASFFDIDWRPAHDKGLEDKVLLPILGRPYEDALVAGELSLALDEQGLCVRYYEWRLPLDPKSYRAVLARRLDDLRGALGGEASTYRRFVGLIETSEKLPDRVGRGRARVDRRRHETRTLKEGLWRLYKSSPEVQQFLDDNLRAFNATKGDRSSFEPLDRLLGDQPYRLAFWRDAIGRLNYRRFFDIGDLVCMRVEEPRVFDAAHALVVRLAEEGKVSGLRVDHVDGLYDPLGYLRRLQSRLSAGDGAPQRRGPGFYVIVEKILAADETLPRDWPVSGTTGYDFLNSVNRLFVDADGLPALDETYARFTGSPVDFADVRYARKKQVMEELFAGELDSLAREAGRLSAREAAAGVVSSRDLARALAEVTACLTVYRTYVRGRRVAARDRDYIERAIEEARRRNPSLGRAALDFLGRVLLLRLGLAPGPEQRRDWLRFVMRWQQFTGPVMAKGLEDTALYVHNRLISLNEVGGDPGGASARRAVEAFHEGNRARLVRWPHSLNATSTHDTKRGEDVRARIDALSEVPETWAACVDRWSRWNRRKKRLVHGRPVPDANEELLLYQTLVGAWPLRDDDVAEFKQRVQAFMVKAAREAKTSTNWISPDEEYEGALVAFVESILDAGSQSEFLSDLLEFQRKVAYCGAMNSLAQVVLKIASPGVPDFYQGAELWDLSLVDPDNRRPVDFARRASMLEDLNRRHRGGAMPLVRDLVARWQDGRIKLYLTAKALQFRRANAELFADGDYVPLSASQEGKVHVVAFARRRQRRWALVVAARLAAGLSDEGRATLAPAVWGESALTLPDDAPKRWHSALTAETIDGSDVGRRRVLPLRDLLAELPVALLAGTREEG